MGLIDALVGRSKVLEFVVAFNGREVGVSAALSNPAVHPSEYIRWCNAYTAQILYNLG